MRTYQRQPETVVVSEVPAVAERPSTREWLTERIDGRVGFGVGIAWLVLTEIAVALEPPAQRSEPVIGVLLAIAMYSLIIAMAWGLVIRKRWGLAASLAGALLATVAEIACPVSGHHQFGTWWYGGMACMVTLVVASVVTLFRDYTYLDR